ncbi:bacillithiol biosynthesis cysteine-adding enzyme BshC [Bacillus massilinigeriensis]|uniref:bacillithiol biosynthesis cysteine-adding enzyme BshC n=1 Tax=Bacillus mediterraneensis TaxID=1805474 RepID=UPI0008F8CF31|nr:bacillithiol biosynthesis cysteine-adding enzyme BshC [Bacillus mediterraneensis]
MEIYNLALPAMNRFSAGYLEGVPSVTQLFHYDYKQESHYKRRLEELKERNFARIELADHIESFMSRYPSSEEVKRNLAKLRKENSVAVIGGQQAGILTGPLYTIHKIISIIALARQKESELGIPVVPVFWIAGEDHDYQEINHVYVMRNGNPEKMVYPQKQLEKTMASQIRIDREECRRWIHEVLKTYGETEHTKALLEFVEKTLADAESIVDFFAAIIMELFKEHGLLIVDSGNPELRVLEKDHFAKVINNSKAIAEAVMNQQQTKSFFGYKNSLEMQANAMNLFYYDREHEGRILLYRNEQEGTITGKNGEISFTESELLELALKHPEALSNNVVTRPLMQEWLFPVLGFIGGPGEIAYWSELKLVFEHFGMMMPPIVPRLNITLLDRSVDADLAELSLDLLEVMEFGIERQKHIFISSIKDGDLDDIFINLKEEIKIRYSGIREHLCVKEPSLVPLLEKNERILLSQINFIAEKTKEPALRKNEAVLRKYDRIANSLRPLGIPQERVWNPFWYFNKYGIRFVQEILKQKLTFDGSHKIVKM